MADSEWFEIEPTNTPGTYPNLEAADRAAQQMAAAGMADCVAVVRYSTTTVRRYRRRVTVTAEDVQAQ